MRKDGMKTQSVLWSLAIMAIASASWALLPPPEGEVLANYDMRSTPKGLLLGGSSGSSGLTGNGDAFAPAGAARQASLQRLASDAGEALSLSWNAANGMPKRLAAERGFLTGPDARDAAVIARSFLSEYRDLFGLSDQALSSLDESRRFTTRDKRSTILHLQQEVDGIPVLHGLVSFILSHDGRVAQVMTGNALAELGSGFEPSLGAGEALMSASGHAGAILAAPLAVVSAGGSREVVFELGPYLSEPRASLLLFPVSASEARLGWLVLLDTPDYPAYYAVVVDARDGSLLWRYNMTNYVATSGKVFHEHPEAEGFVTTVTPFADDIVDVRLESRLGWVEPGRDVTFGNNIDSKEDNAGDNEMTIGLRTRDAVLGAPIFFEQDFLNGYNIDADWAADTRIAITQLFYFGNFVHDWLYERGFDEAAGNFQSDNFGLGGRPGDRAYLDAQDNIGTYNNANFSTPPDGSPPRGQFYLFRSPPFARKDSDFDGDVVAHEYGHGLSNRLVGGGVGCIQGLQGCAMGEGWSDILALLIFSDPDHIPPSPLPSVMGEYSTGDTTAGIRSHDYDFYPACHHYDGSAFCPATVPTCSGFVGGCQCHDEGQLMAATVWEMRKAIVSAFPVEGPDDVATLFVDGLKFTVCGPTFLDFRDALLLADRLDFGGKYYCYIWRAFADRWMGFGATSTDPDDTDPVGSTTMPPACLSVGEVTLDLDVYSCDTVAKLSVADGDAGVAPTVTVTATSGDAEDVPTTGIGPVFTATFPIRVVTPFTPMNGTLEVASGDTIRASYADPPIVAETTALVSCLADVSVELRPGPGGCDADDAAGWPRPLPPVLDAGERMTLTVAVTNNTDADILDASLRLVDTDSDYVVVTSTNPVTGLVIERVTGAHPGTPGVDATGNLPTFEIFASHLAAPSAGGPITLEFELTSPGHTGTISTLTADLALHMDYTSVLETTGVESFETGDGGYTHYAWPGLSFDPWARSMCDASDGVWAFRAGNPSCTGTVTPETDANLQSPVLNPMSPTLRPDWYPVELSWQHKLQIGSSGSLTDEFVVFVTEPDFLEGGAWINSDFGDYTAADNTGGAFEPQSLTFPSTVLVDNNVDASDGLVWWFDFWTNSASPLSTEWVIDEVEFQYQVAELVPQGTVVCRNGIFGTLSGCSAGTPFLYNLKRPDEAQFPDVDGAFWVTLPEWNFLDVEFPTPSATGDTLGMVVSSNPGGGSHPGQMGLNGRILPTVPISALDFGATTCAAIPTPTAPATVPEGATIMISWTPFAESGPADLIIGYNVYRVDAEALPPAASMISDYTGGFFVGSTFGLSDINAINDTAPSLVTGMSDAYTYAIQPLLKCTTPGTGVCVAGGRYPLTFGGTEGDVTGGEANLSTDSAIVTVTPALYVAFDSYKAAQIEGGVRVTWTTSVELDVLGFHVYWGAEPDALTRATTTRIPSTGPHSSYVFDGALPEGYRYFQVVEVSATGAPPSSTPVFSFDPRRNTGATRDRDVSRLSGDGGRRRR